MNEQSTGSLQNRGQQAEEGTEWRIRVVNRHTPNSLDEQVGTTFEDVIKRGHVEKRSWARNSWMPAEVGPVIAAASAMDLTAIALLNACDWTWVLWHDRAAT